MLNLKDLKKITEEPGCYFFKDKENKIIYIGKANNLKKRINSYFRKNGNHLRRNFISKIEKIDFFVTKNSKEALILEHNLIKKNKPRFNVILKNNNQYPYIHITNENNPRYILSYKIFNKKLDYFGPFPDGSKAKEILSLLERIFPLAKCKKSFQKKPCLYYEIGQCSGHCFKEVEENYYKEIKKNVTNFFNGKTKEIKLKINNSLKKNIKNLSFEIAQKQKKILDSIDFFVSSQNIEFKDRKNRDFLGIFFKKDFLAINLLIYRYGKFSTSHEKIFFLSEKLSNYKEIIQTYVFDFYKENIVPKHLYSSENILYKFELEEIFKLLNRIPKKGKMKEILNLAISNAKNLWNKNFFNDFNNVNREKILKKISKLLNIKNLYNIEALDISNIFLQDSIASFSFFINGEYIKSKFYQLNKQKSDLDYIEKACDIHYKNINKENIPNLIVIDGSKEQVKSAKKSLKKSKINCKIIGLAKNIHHKTKKIITEELEEIEFEDEEIKKFFTTIQETVHNNAIKEHRKLHIKNTLKKI